VYGLPGKSRGQPLSPDAEVGRDRPIAIDTPVGVAEVFVEPANSKARAWLVLGHGAGGDVDAPDLVAVTAAVVALDVWVARVRQPYRVLGRRSPAPAAQLDAAWSAAVLALRDRRFGGRSRSGRSPSPLFVGGRSSGARVACRTALEVGASGVVALAFPLHPPGHPEKTRVAELEAGVPLLVVQGARDTFGTPAEFPRGVRVRPVPGAGHGLGGAELPSAATDVAGWILQQLDST
jgi:predicted alpha/beta-hydrolase family hydrolase